jgi:hypothetical protein
MSGRRASDWLSLPPANGARQDGRERRGQDRRADDRRAPMRKIDVRFCATLVSQIDARKDASPPVRAYAPRGHRPGIVADLKA